MTEPHTARAYLSLGSNLDAEAHLRAALRAMREQFGELTVSSVYRTAAVGFEGPPFLNLAVGLWTTMTPDALNDWLHALEDRHGRRRDKPRFSSRTLDADIVLYDDLVTTGRNHLEIPRGELVKHAFVLQPMADIAGDVVHPTLGLTIAALWEKFRGPRECKVVPIDLLL